MSTVCAIVPTFNRREMLGECLFSLLVQTRPPDRILVVDDGSTDGTAAFVKERFGAAVTLLHKENGGKSSALNHALPHCAGDYVWICDDDDIAAPDGCGLLAEALDRAGPKTAFTYGHHRIFAESEDGELALFPPSFWPSPDEPDVRISTMEDLAAFQFATLFRRTALMEAGPFREDLHRSQDLDMLLRITGRRDGAYVPRTIFYQRDHAGQRGPARERAEVAQSHRKWLAADRKFFPELALSDRSFCPSFARDLPPVVQQRAAFLQRGVVFGRRGMWAEALPALAEACLLGGLDRPLPQEERLAARLVRHGLPADALPHRQPFRAPFSALRSASPYAALLMQAVGTALLQRARGAAADKRYGDAALNLRMAQAASGGRVFTRQLLAKLRGTSLTEPGQRLAPHQIVLPQEREELRNLLTDARTRLGLAPTKKATP